MSASTVMMSSRVPTLRNSFSAEAWLRTMARTWSLERRAAWMAEAPMLPVAPTIRTVCILVRGGGDGLRYGWASACWLNSGVRYPKKKKKKKGKAVPTDTYIPAGGHSVRPKVRWTKGISKQRGGCLHSITNYWVWNAPRPVSDTRQDLSPLAVPPYLSHSAVPCLHPRDVR